MQHKYKMQSSVVPAFLLLALCFLPGRLRGRPHRWILQQIPRDAREKTTDTKASLTNSPVFYWYIRCWMSSDLHNLCGQHSLLHWHLKNRINQTLWKKELFIRWLKSALKDRFSRQILELTVDPFQLDRKLAIKFTW